MTTIIVPNTPDRYHLPPVKQEVEELVLSANGRSVRKGGESLASIKERVPEISFEEIELDEVINSGCFGTVFKGRCRGKPVAVKRLVKQQLDAKTLEDFRKEVDIMSQMRHPNIVLFMGACTEPGRMCMVSELMARSVHDLIRQPSVELTLAQRLKLCIDAASGLAWLHGAKPQVIHRDLKPHNLLIDEHGIVKICDFGLSAVKPLHGKLRDGKSIPGTPLWMAPEVLLGRELDDKADVYSFGIVLWEVITGLEPFAHMTNFASFKQAVTVDHERPPIPDDLPNTLRALMHMCWHPDKQRRPSLVELLPLLDGVLVDCLIDEPRVNGWWKRHFVGRERVGWREFAPLFAADLLLLPAAVAWRRRFADSLSSDSADSRADAVDALLRQLDGDINVMCLRKILVDSEPTGSGKGRATQPGGSGAGSSTPVSLEQLSRVLNWFGPAGPPMLDKMRLLMQKDWFHGNIDKQSAEELLSGQPCGTFLVRTSHTVKQYPFTISKVNKKSQINHQRLFKRPDGLFEVQVQHANGKTGVALSSDDQLVNFIRALSSDLFLDSACPGSRFNALFMHKKSAGYLQGYLEEAREHA